MSSYDGAIIAYSGGVDSTFLAYVAHGVLGKQVKAVTASSEIYPQDEIQVAGKIAQQIGLSHMIIVTEELADTNFTLDLQGFRSGSLNEILHS